MKDNVTLKTGEMTTENDPGHPSYKSHFKMYYNKSNNCTVFTVYLIK